MPIKDPDENRRYQREYKRKQILVGNTSIQRNRAFLRTLKATTPCADCGMTYPYYVMQFDHVRGKKVANLNILRNYALAKIMAELEKCDVVCANCHAIRTHVRRTADVRFHGS